MSEMKTIPFIAPYYKGKEIPRTSMTMCKEFDGDCMQYVQKYLKVKWINEWCETATSECQSTYFDGHSCEPEAIS